MNTGHGHIPGHKANLTTYYEWNWGKTPGWICEPRPPVGETWGGRRIPVWPRDSEPPNPLQLAPFTEPQQVGPRPSPTAGHYPTFPGDALASYRLWLLARMLSPEWQKRTPCQHPPLCEESSALLSLLCTLKLSAPAHVMGVHSCSGSCEPSVRPTRGVDLCPRSKEGW